MKKVSWVMLIVRKEGFEDETINLLRPNEPIYFDDNEEAFEYTIYREIEINSKIIRVVDQLEFRLTIDNADEIEGEPYINISVHLGDEVTVALMNDGVDLKIDHPQLNGNNIETIQ